MTSQSQSLGLKYLKRGTWDENLTKTKELLLWLPPLSLPLPTLSSLLSSLKRSRYLRSLLPSPSPLSFASPPLLIISHRNARKKKKRKDLSPPPSFLLALLTKHWNFNQFPFQFCEEFFFSFVRFPLQNNPSHLFSCLTNLLGSAHPERIALLQEPFSTSVEKESHFSNYYYHQDLHYWKFQANSHWLF